MTTAAGATTTTFTSAGARATTATGKVLYATSKARVSPLLPTGRYKQWNGTLDWTTELSYFSFLEKCMCYFKRTLTFS